MNLHTSSIDSENFSSITNPLSQISNNNCSNVQHAAPPHPNNTQLNQNVNVNSSPIKALNQKPQQFQTQIQRNTINDQRSPQQEKNQSNKYRNLVKIYKEEESRHPFKGGVEFDQIFQKEYFEEVLNPPGDSSVSYAGDLSSQRSSPFKSDTGKFSINSILKEPTKNISKSSAFGNIGNGGIINEQVSMHKQDMSPQRRGHNQDGLSKTQEFPLNLTSHISNSFLKMTVNQSQQDNQRFQNLAKQNEASNSQWREALENIKAAEQACEEDNILESMSQLLKAVNELKIAKNTNDNQILPQGQSQIDTFEASEKMTRKQNFKINASRLQFQESLQDSYQRLDNQAQSKHNQVQAKEQDEGPVEIHNQWQNQSKNVTRNKGIEFQFKTQQVNGMSPILNQQAQSPLNSQILNVASPSTLTSQRVNQSKQKSLSPLSQYNKHPSSFLNKSQKSSTNNSSSRSPKRGQMQAQTNLLLNKLRNKDTSNSKNFSNVSLISSSDPAQDVINRLFQNHKRSQEQKDKRRYVQMQQEISLMQDKPTISEKSKQLASQSQMRMNLPIYSQERYQQEIESFRSRREQAQKLKELKDKERDLLEEEEIQKYHQKYQNKKLDMNEFQRKYDNQVRKWETRKNQIPGLGDNENENSENARSKSPSFRPQINPKSRQLAKDIKRIEDRMTSLQINKKVKQENLERASLPSFKPDLTTYTAPSRNKSFDKNGKDSSQQNHTPTSSSQRQLINKLSTLQQASPQQNYEMVQTQSKSVKAENKVNDQRNEKRSHLSQYLKTNQSETKVNLNNQIDYKMQMSMDTLNLEQYLKTLNMNEQAQNTQMEVSPQLDLLKEYMKLKQEINHSLSNRTSNLNYNQNSLVLLNHNLEMLDLDKSVSMPFDMVNTLRQSEQLNQDMKLEGKRSELIMTNPSNKLQDIKVVRSKRQMQSSQMMNGINKTFSPDRFDKTRLGEDIQTQSPSQYSTIQDNLQNRDFEVVMSEEAANEQANPKTRNGIEPYRSNSNSPNRYNSTKLYNET